MLFQPGYTYETKNIVKSFLGTMKADGFFEPVSETEYGGWIKVAARKASTPDARPSPPQKPSPATLCSTPMIPTSALSEAETKTETC